MADPNIVNIILNLEASAGILLAPPNAISVDQRRSAEAVFIEFQKTKSPFQLCRYILENSKVEYIHFQAACLLKQSVVREWVLLGGEDRESLRTYLLQYVMQNPGIASFVREQILLVVAIMVKRGGVEIGPHVIENILGEVSQMISSGNPALQTVGCSILSSLLNEYSSTTRSSDMGLTWETHLIAKKKFETSDLKRIFQYCLQGLNELSNKMEGQVGPEAAALMKRFLLIAEQVLVWNFQVAMLLPRKLITLFEQQQYPTLRPTNEWRDVLLQPNVTELFFKLHWQLRNLPDLCHHVLQCLNQLASLNGVLMSSDDDRKLYLTWFMNGMLKMLNYTEIYEHEALNMSNIISRFELFFPPTIMSTLPADILQTYLAHLTRISCHFAENASKEEGLDKNSQIYVEAFEHLLEAWVTILQDANLFPPDSVRQSAIQIFNRYLQCHIAPPEGVRGVNSEEADNREIDEIEEDDRTKFKDQLIVIGLLGRHCLGHCVPLLVKLLEEKVARLHSELQRIQHCAMTVSDSAMLETLNEDIHWLTMISGHLLSAAGEGEIVLIPAEITQYCNEQSSSVRLETTLQVLASPGHRIADIPGAEQTTDPIVRLISAVIRMCEIEKRALEANLVQLLSPELARTLVWFIQQWSVSYLLPNDNYSNKVAISTTLKGAFGQDTEGGLWTLNFLLSKLDSNLTLWGTEHKLATETTECLVTLLNNSQRGGQAMSCDSLATILQKQSENIYHNLPTMARRCLIKALVIAGTANRNTRTKNKYWDDLLKPLESRFHALLYSESFQQCFQSEQVKNQVMDLIECFVGVADGSTILNMPRIFPFLLPVMNDLVKLVDLYHNYSNIVGTVFQFFCACAKRILFFLSQEESKSFYKCCLSMIEIYAKHNAGRLSREVNAEEEQFQDILMLMQLLSDLLSKDFIDFSPRSPITRLVKRLEGSPPILSVDEVVDQDPVVLAGDVALSGLRIIMPLMTNELLKFPSLCLQYYKLVTFICEIYPNKICQLQPELFKTLLLSVQMGLTSFTSEITNMSLDFLSVLGTHVFKAELKGELVYEALEPFLKNVFDLVILQPLDPACTFATTNTLFTLICCFQEKFQELVQSLINSQSDPNCSQRLLDSFTQLTTGFSFVMDRPNRCKFKEKFEKFLTTIYGFLCIK